MNVEMSRMEARIRLGGVFDGSRAMQLLNALGRFKVGQVVVDFSGIQQFEPFGVEVLANGLAGPPRGGARVRCLGLPPCVAERLREEEIAMGALGSMSVEERQMGLPM